MKKKNDILVPVNYQQARGIILFVQCFIHRGILEMSQKNREKKNPTCFHRESLLVKRISVEGEILS